MKFLKHRSHQDELMDDPNIPFEEFRQTLGEIEKINQMTGSYGPTLKALARLLDRSPPQPLRILDVGFGNGDFLRRIHRWAHSRKVKVELSGVDLNPWAKKAAELITPASMKIRYVTSNIFDFKPEEPYHVIINSFFTHHLKDEQIVEVMRWMTERAQVGWVINDIHRHVIPYFFIRYYVRLLGYNRLVRHDAALSVARAFTRSDWETLVEKSALPKERIRISWHWPFRYGVTYVV